MLSDGGEEGRIRGSERLKDEEEDRRDGISRCFRF